MHIRRRLPPLALLASLLLLAACSPAAPMNEPPAVTITSPSANATYSAGEPIVLAASATDAEDGDLTPDITWSSSLDGALSPSPAGQVLLSVGAHELTARVTDSAGKEGSASVSVTVTDTVATHVVADGRTLRLLNVSSGKIEELDSAQLPALSPYQAIYAVVAHPTQPWLYTASMRTGWGDARIDRFVLAGDTITHGGAAFTYPFSGIAAGCVYGNEDDCAPIGMVFSPDGSRFYVEEDDYDVVQIFSVDAAGALTFITEGASTSVHGLTIDPTGTYLYNGSNVIEVTDDVPVTVFSGTGGNATQLIDLAGGPGLISTSSTSTVVVYDLTDPVLPVALASLNLGRNQARDLAFTDGLGRIVTVGRNNVRTLAFDGAAIAAEGTYTVSEAFNVEYRGVGLTNDAGFALASWFSNDAAAPVIGGVELFEIAADGALTLVDSVDFTGPARVVVSLP